MNKQLSKISFCCQLQGRNPWRYFYILTLSSFLWLFTGILIWGQSNGDYGTRATGNWNDNATWQVYNGGWVNCAAGDYPGATAGAGTVNIQNNHTVTITADVPNSVGALSINGGNQDSYIQFNAGVSLTVNGQTYLNSTNNNDEKSILVDAGIFNTGSVSANSSGDNRDAYIRISTGTVTVDGDIDLNSTNLRTYILFTGNGTLYAGGTISGGNITSAVGGGATAPTSGTVNYNNTGAQQVGAYTYYDLTISGGNTKTIQGDVTVNNVLDLTNGNLSLGAGTNNLTIGNAGSITGPFDNTHMIVCDGNGSLVREGNANADYNMVYPLGTGTLYTPVQISNFTSSDATGDITIRAISGVAPGPPPASSDDLQKYWDITTNGLTITTADVSFYYDQSEVGSVGREPAYVTSVYDGLQWLTPGSYGIDAVANRFYTTGTNILTGEWTAKSPVTTYYSYQTGDWGTATTWTTDPSGTTLVGSAVPGNDDAVVILPGRTVSLTTDVTTTGLNISINSGGALDLSTYQFTSAVSSLSGEGTLKIASANHPTVTSNLFVQAGGGTTEYYNSADFTLPAAQNTYNNLRINTPGVVATQLSNIIINGNLHVKQGTYRINDNTSARRQLTINGNVTVDNGASWTVGTGVTNTTTNPIGITGGAAPFINYYNSHSHRVVINGDFTNNGTVRFTNLPYPVYNAFPPTAIGATTGFATVYFMDATDNTLTCNGTTDFYNLVLDKGIDQTYKLTVYSSAYQNFRLFGANVAGGDSPGNNPNLKKALWVRTGTLVLKGLTIIPSLTEGTCDGNPNSDFYVPANGALVLDGPDVVVLSTADDYREVNIAYGTTAPSNGAIGIGTGGCSSFSILGKLQINDGFLSTKESGGFITWDWASGQFIINGGIVDAKQFRAAGGAGGLASFEQNGGTFILRGRFQRTPTAYTNISNLTDVTVATLNTSRAGNGTNGAYGTFNLNNAANVFIMSGGTIRIYDVCGAAAGQQEAFDIYSSTANINVTGGTIELIPTTGTGGDAANFLITTTGPIGNLIINRESSTTDTRLNTYPLTVLENLTITSGSLLANNLDLTIGGNFSIVSTGLYNSGTNITTFNGSKNQTFSIDGTINNGASGLQNMVINKPSGTLNLSGTQTSLTVQGNFSLTRGIFDDNGKTIYIAGNVTNSGTHISTPGTGSIQLNGNTAIQTIGGNGNGIFNNLALNNTNAAAAPVSLSAKITLNGTLSFLQDKLFNINTNNLILNSAASIINSGANRYVQTSGNAGDGGLTIFYPSPAAITFPVGAASASHALPDYTPATIGFTGTPTALGSITVIPVGYEHPATTTNGRSLTYFWRVKSSGFTLGAANVTHGYTYSQNDVVTGGDVTENGYVAARYNAPTYTWTKGTANDVDDAVNNIIGEPGAGSFLENVTFIDGDYTAGDDDATDPFGTPAKYYSRQSGLWNDVNTWSTASHSGPAASAVPGANDVVIIGDNDSVYLFNEVPPFPVNNNNPAATYYQRNKVLVDCASLQIEAGSVLDIQNNPGCNFGFVLSHPGGNGKIRITTRDAGNFDNPEPFVFPSGDFSDFNVNNGISEFYTINPQAGTYYILPSNANSYGTVILTPLRGSNIILPNIPEVTIYGDLICSGSDADAWLAMSWNGEYGAIVPKTVSVKGNLNVVGGSFGFIYNTTTSQQIIIDGDVYVAPGAGIDVWVNTTNNSMSIGGSLINNSDNTIAPYGTPSIVRFRNGGNLCDVTFFGSNNASITNTQSTPTTVFNNVTINKGTSQATTLTCDITGTLTTPTNNWLTLQNGTFRYIRTGNLNITTTNTFTIPGTAGLYINTPSNVYLANNAVNTNDVYLNGKLILINGTVYIGPAAAPGNNNDIEYSGGGLSEIEVQGGSLIVNGQIRRNPATTNGILDYTQSGGTVTINGNAAITTNAKLEIVNDGSSFNMSGGTLTIVRGGGGNTYGDLYLRPETSNVTGGDIVFAHNLSGQNQLYLLDATVPLNNITITGRTAATAANATVKLLINPLVLNGYLTLTNANSIFDANSAYNINVTINGDFTNNGTYNYYQNLTTFNGNTQSLLGTSTTNFYNLNVNPITSLTLSRNVTVYNDLAINSGTLACGTYYVYVTGDIENNGTYTDNNTGIVLNGSSIQNIGGTGTFGRLELNNSTGARSGNNITFQENLILTSGIFDINSNLLTLGTNSIVVANGTPFGPTKMITSDGVFSNVGIRKFFATGASTFTYPIGCVNKYTPAQITITANGSVGSIRLNNINDRHPGVIDPANVLKYYWEVESSGISGFSGNLVLNYLESDVQGTLESDYVAARLVIPGTSWSKAAPGPGTDNVDETNNQITFTFTGTNNLSGEYTAGTDAAIPVNVPTYTSNNNGDWTDNTIWTQTAGDPYPCPVGGPNGFIVIIDHQVTANANYCFAYRTTINNELRIVASYFGHNLGTVTGNGTLYLESGLFPAGRFNTFLDCSNNGTLEYGGSGNYNIVADLYTNIPNLLFTGTGTRYLPNKDLIICRKLEINGPALDNSVNNRKLTIQGTMERYTPGTFISGTGAGATVSFAGSASQSLGGATGDFSGTNAFNNLEINNSSGLTLYGTNEVKGNLVLTNGNITTTNSNILYLSNTAINCVTPAGGSSSSFINGPIRKRINQGDNFNFPIGKGTRLGNKLTLLSTQTGTLDWTTEFFTPNPYGTYTSPLSAVNLDEYWTVNVTAGNQTIVNISWDPLSDLTPAMTQNGLSDMRVAEHDGANWLEITSTATGDNNNGSVETSNRVTLAAGTRNFTIACINTVKPKATLTPTGPVCGTAGIPVTFTLPNPTLPYTLSYNYNSTPQTPVVINSLPYTLPTDAAGGTYQLTAFSFDGGTGVVNPNVITTYAVPTTADAGPDQTGIATCGATSTTLAANTPGTGTGLWSIISGTGGTVVTPTSPPSDFNGTNGSTYTLRWTISNGTCTSSDDMVVTFNINPSQPADFTTSSSTVCQGQNSVVYTVPNDLTVTYNWSYSGIGANINGTTNSVSVDFGATATDGNLSVTATNGCGTSAPRLIAITVNEMPTITLGTYPSVCQGADTAELPYSAVSGSPNQYNVVYDAIALGQGFVNVTNAVLGPSPVSLVVPVAASINVYNADFSVRNSATGCTSSDYAITITINPLPVPTISGPDTICQGTAGVYTTEAGMGNYVWTVTDEDGTSGHTITAGGGTTNNSITIRWDGFEDHTVSVTYTNGSGCTAASPTELPIWVFKLPEPGPAHHIPNDNVP